MNFSGLPPARPSCRHDNRTKSDNQLSKVKDEIVTVTKTMQNNMSKVLDRGSKLEDLQDKTGNIIFLLAAISCKGCGTGHAPPPIPRHVLKK